MMLLRTAHARLSLGALAAFSALAPLPAAPVRDGHVVAELIAEPAAIRSGQPFTVGLHLRMDEHWHTYWKNSGDSGIATSIAWTLPPGFSAGEIQWPAPQRIPTPPLMTYGYEGEVTLLVEITPPATLPAGSPVTLAAHTEWLVCKEECLPGEANVVLTLPVTTDAPRPDPETAARFAAARARLPVVDASSWSANFEVLPDGLTLSVAVPRGVQVDPAGVYFFPITPDVVAPAAAQTATLADGRLVMKLAKSEYWQAAPATLAGVLTASGGFPPAQAGRAIAISAAPGADGAASAAGDTSLLGNILLAFVGGLILNLMPCVFPVLGIKIMGFVNQAGADRRKVTLHGIVFTIGVLLCFWALASVLLILRAGGQQLGWGFQLQSPAFVFGLAVFLLAFGMNMSGAFEFGLSATSVGGSLQMKSGYAGSFFTGVLATVVSTPCAAPFLAPALGAALVLPPAQSLTLFTVIGIGLSTPYLVLSIFPHLVKMLPRPGAWMETFKQAMAFPLYGTVAFLVYVLAGQLSKNDEALFAALGGLVLVAIACWIYGKWTQGGASGRRRVLGYGFAAAFLAGGLVWGYPSGQQSDWQEWRPEAAEKLRDSGKIVYVDFTARWCATCKVNKLAVFSSQEVNDEFQRLGVVKLKADWTNKDEEITRALARFGRSAVPFNLVYVPGRAEPIRLPEVLTPGIVLDALHEAGMAAATASASSP